MHTHTHIHTHSVPESSGGVENDVLVRSSALIISKFFERSRRRLHTHTHTHVHMYTHDITLISKIKKKKKDEAEQIRSVGCVACRENDTHPLL